MKMLLEICVDSVGAIEEAVAGGADRLELCAALEFGGVTPSGALIDRAVASGVPVHVLVRPRAGGFVMADNEPHLVVADIRQALARGASGVVVGALRRDGGLDREALARFREATGDAVAVLHRAVDLAADPVRAVEEACELGYDKVLSSGGAATAIEGAATLARMVRVSRGRSSIIAGGGVRPQNVAALVAASGIGEVHGSASRSQAEDDIRVVKFGFGPAVSRRTDRAIVLAMRTALDQRESAR